MNWYQEQGRGSEVLPLLERAARQWPEDEVMGRTLGIYRFKRKDCPGALAAAGPFERNTTDPNTLNALALFQTCLGKRQDAIVLLEKSLALKPDQPGAIQSLNILKRGSPKG